MVATLTLFLGQTQCTVCNCDGLTRRGNVLWRIEYSSSSKRICHNQPVCTCMDNNNSNYQQAGSPLLIVVFRPVSMWEALFPPTIGVSRKESSGICWPIIGRRWQASIVGIGADRQSQAKCWKSINVDWLSTLTVNQLSKSNKLGSIERSNSQKGTILPIESTRRFPSPPPPRWQSINQNSEHWLKPKMAGHSPCTTNRPVQIGWLQEQGTTRRLLAFAGHPLLFSWLPPQNESLVRILGREKRKEKVTLLVLHRRRMLHSTTYCATPTLRHFNGVAMRQN